MIEDEKWLEKARSYLNLIMAAEPVRNVTDTHLEISQFDIGEIEDGIAAFSEPEKGTAHYCKLVAFVAAVPEWKEG